MHKRIARHSVRGLIGLLNISLYIFENVRVIGSEGLTENIVQRRNGGETSSATKLGCLRETEEKDEQGQQEGAVVSSSRNKLMEGGRNARREGGKEGVKEGKMESRRESRRVYMDGVCE